MHGVKILHPFACLICQEHPPVCVERAEQFQHAWHGLPPDLAQEGTQGRHGERPVRFGQHLLLIRGLGDPPFYKGDQGLATQPREDISSWHVKSRGERLHKTGITFDQRIGQIEYEDCLHRTVVPRIAHLDS
jgi:hypothetical protein